MKHIHGIAQPDNSAKARRSVSIVKQPRPVRVKQQVELESHKECFRNLYVVMDVDNVKLLVCFQVDVMMVEEIRHNFIKFSGVADAVWYDKSLGPSMLVL